MNKTYSTLTVLILGLAAIGVCLRQTFEVSGSLGRGTMAILIFVEVVAALAMLAIGFSLVKRASFVRPKRASAFRPLRRLFSAVWS